jgi:predicted MFS family arabinose efflux permease
VTSTPEPVATPERRWPPPALRVRPFRWYWAAQWPTLLGTWMQVVALGYLVYQQTGSTTAVAAVAAADGIPSVVLSLAGGVLADRLPRRRILLVTQSLLGLSAGSLALLVATNHASFAAILVVAIVFGATDAADLPTRQALVADLVDRHLVVNAVALGAAAMSATRIVGPSVAGLLIGFAGPAVCFGFLAVAYLAPIVVLLKVIPDVTPLPRQAGATAWGELVAGLRVAAADPLVRGVVIVASVLAFCGVSYMPFLPVLARTQLHVGPAALGIMYSVGGVGGLVGGLAIASMGRGAGRLQLMLVGGVVYAASLFVVAHSALLGFTLPALVGISFAFVAVSTSMTTLLQTDTDPALRGRLLGIYATIFAGLQPLGTVAYGLMPHSVGLFNAIGVGALLVGATTVLVVITPSFRGRVNGSIPSRAVAAAAPDTLA